MKVKGIASCGGNMNYIERKLIQSIESKILNINIIEASIQIPEIFLLLEKLNNNHEHTRLKELARATVNNLVEETRNKLKSKK